MFWHRGKEKGTEICLCFRDKEAFEKEKPGRGLLGTIVEGNKVYIFSSSAKWEIKTLDSVTLGVLFPNSVMFLTELSPGKRIIYISLSGASNIAVGVI